MGHEDFDNKHGIYSKKLKAGRRTFFFDVKEARNGEYYLNISELAKKTGHDGQQIMIRSKIFVYKEDFDTFIEELQNTVAYIRQAKGADYGVEGRIINDDSSEYDMHNSSRQSRRDAPPPSNNDPNSTDYRADFTFDDL